MSIKRLRQKIDKLRSEIVPSAAGANLVSNRFVVIRNGAEDDGAVAEAQMLAKAADEKAVIIWVVDPPSNQQQVTP